MAQASCFANSCRADDSNELFCCPLRKGPEELGGQGGGAIDPSYFGRIRGPKLKANPVLSKTFEFSLPPQISRPSTVSLYDNEGPWFTCTKRNNK